MGMVTSLHVPYAVMHRKRNPSEKRSVLPCIHWQVHFSGFSIAVGVATVARGMTSAADQCALTLSFRHGIHPSIANTAERRRLPRDFVLRVH
tara:strand:+ start:308 stop:583 length:276 start_codon:yes stop_codon:yes gene_type:complete